MAEENIKKVTKILQNFEELGTFWIDPGLKEFSSLWKRSPVKIPVPLNITGEVSAGTGLRVLLGTN